MTNDKSFLKSKPAQYKVPKKNAHAKWQSSLLKSKLCQYKNSKYQNALNKEYTHAYCSVSNRQLCFKS